ncbi:MAG: UbiA family prenyltransferase [Planctomycetes bacterium]|nr:UbiA family prenyltransferase [Planctomycetota bacterium]
MSGYQQHFKEFSELLKIEHSLFALPFAFIGAFMAMDGLGPNEAPTLITMLLIIGAMFFARTAGMSFNRVLDAKIDKHNPRTADRAIPAGRISPLLVWAVGIGSLCGLSLCALGLNPLAFYLSPLCHILLFTYSLTKRFTWGCHLFLGLVEAFAPIGGWIAIKGSCHQAEPYLLGLATIFWIGGMDVVYATQDADYDKGKGLHSIPSRFGLRKSFLLARAFHLLTVCLLVATAYFANTGLWFYSGCIVVSALFVYQHSLVSPERREKLNFAFFGVNSWIALTLMLASFMETRVWGFFL